MQAEPPIVALTRPVPDSLNGCELTHLTRIPIDLARARAQHTAYEAALVSLGCDLRRVAAAPDLADSVFVEDVAVVLDEVAIITMPGAVSRRAERGAVAEALSPWRRVAWLSLPGTLDGGDVLRLARVLYVGVGGRSNQEGARQLEELTGPYGYHVRTVAVSGCLHLKSAITEAAPGLVLVNPAWVDPLAFDAHETIAVDAGEPFAANVLRIGRDVLASAAFDRTNSRLRSAGLDVRTLDVSELAKAEAALTCCSVIFNA